MPEYPDVQISPLAPTSIEHASADPSPQSTPQKNSAKDGSSESILDIESSSSEEDDSDFEEQKSEFIRSLVSQLSGFHGCRIMEMVMGKNMEQEKDDEDSQELESENSLLPTLSEGSITGLEIFKDPSTDNEIPDVLGSHKLLSAGSCQMSPSNWKTLFTGLRDSDVSEKPPIVSLLHTQRYHPALPRRPQLQWDLDSILAFPTSLACARHGISYQANPNIVYNIKSDVHLTMKVLDNTDPDHPRMLSKPLHKIPHYCFGQLSRFQDLSIFFFFPRLYDSKNDFIRLTDHNLERWTNHILLPAIYDTLPAGLLQHLPASWQQGKCNSQAAAYESKQRQHGSRPHQQNLRYILLPQFLHQIWTRMLERIKEPGNGHFAGVQLVLNGKNLKMSFKNKSIQRLWTKIGAIWKDNINSIFLRFDKVFLDIAKEIIAPDTFLERTTLSSRLQPQIYLWKRCCLEAYVKWFKTISITKAKGSTMSQLYHEGFLHEAAQLTVLASHRSIAYKAGLVYSQFYASCKELFDSAKQYPFVNPNQEALALDPTMRKAWAKVGKSELFHTDTLQNGYLHCKKRCNEALVASRKKSFGVREEHRMTWSLLQRIMDVIDIEGIEIVLPSPPSSVWVLQTSTYISYLMASINKFALGFEYTLSLCDHNVITWEHTKVMCMFLRCLRYCLGGKLLEKEAALYWDKRRRLIPDGFQESTYRRHYEDPDNDGQVFQVSEGMGLSVGLRKYGYGWLMDKLDWHNFTFKPLNSLAMLFGNRLMYEAYQKHKREVIAVTEDFLIAETVASLLVSLPALPNGVTRQRDPEALSATSPAKKFLQQHLIWLCIRSFRKDVMSLLKSDLQQDKIEASMSGTLPLCYNTLEEVLDPSQLPLYLAGGNRFRYKTVLDLVDYLWNLTDGQERLHWDDKPYRLLYRRCRHIIRQSAGTQGERQFVNQLKLYFVASNWVLPCPSNQGFWQKTKASRGSQRMWTTVYNRFLWNHKETTNIKVLSWTVLEKEMRDMELANWKLTKDSNLVMQCQPQDPVEHLPQSKIELREKVENLVRKQRYQERRGELEGRS